MKTFRQFLSEVKFDFSMKKSDHMTPIKTSNLQSWFNPIGVGKVNDYTITVAKSKLTSAHRVFIHHNKKHVGSIACSIKGKKLKVGDSSLVKEHQGKGVMADVYSHLVKSHGYEIHSDSKQSIGGHKLWKNLNKRTDVNVSEYDRLTKKESTPKFDVENESSYYILKSK